MPVRVWLGRWPVMRVLMMLVVNVAVLVLDRFVAVPMLVTFGQV